MVKAASSEPIRAPLGGRVELECTVFGSPVPQAQWSRGIQLNQVTYYFLFKFFLINLGTTYNINTNYIIKLLFI